MMTLDDGATDRQSDPHTASLRCVKRFEESVHIFPGEPYADVLHGQAHVVLSFSFGSDHQPPRTIIDTIHCLCGIQKQVQNDLLKLDPIACHSGESVGKLRPQRHPASLKFTSPPRTHCLV